MSVITLNYNSLPLHCCNNNTKFHTPIFFPPKLKLHAKKTKAIKLSILSTKKYTILHSIEIPKDSTYLGHIYDSDSEVVCYSLSLLRIFNSKNSLFRDCRQFHGQFVKMGTLNLDNFTRNKLAIMYSRNEKYLDDARKLFDEITEKAIPVYASLMGSYCRNEKWVEFFEIFYLMVYDGLLPNEYLVPTILKACAKMKFWRTGKMVHGFVMRNEMLRDIFVGNSLIDFYSNCWDLRYSRNVFDSMQEKDVVSWTAILSACMDNGYVDIAMDIFESMELNRVKLDLISWNALVSGFARNGEIDLALQYLEKMKYSGLRLQASTWNGVISGCVESRFFEGAVDLFYKMTRSLEKPNVVTVVSILTACAGMKDVWLGKALHGYALQSQFLWNIHVEGSLIDMYIKCGMVDYAKKVFVQAEKKNTALCNAMIAAYVNEGNIDTALGLVKSMVDGDSKPDEITYNAILAGYARHGKKDKAYKVLSEMTEMGLKPNIVSYNILITGFQQYGLTREALNLFKNIKSPNPVTIACSLAACADLSSLRIGKEIHGYVIKSDFMFNIFVSTALVDMYAKCSDMSSATKIFSKIEDKNTVSWNCIIAGHIKDDHPEEGLKQFNSMLLEGLMPSLITFMILLPVCGDMKDLSMGRVLHGFILRSWEIELDYPLTNALVDMYSKCGRFEDAKLVGD